MTKKSHRNKTKRNADAGSNRSPVAGADWPTVVCAAVGGLLALGLAIVKLNEGDLPYCDAGSGCDVVQNSRWSILFGIPIAMWGFFIYAAIAALALQASRQQAKWKWIVFFSTIGICVSIYLTIVSVVEIKALCTYCLVSLGLISAIFALTWYRPRERPSGPWRAGSLVAGIVVSGFLTLHYAGAFDPAAGPEDPYLRSLAEHLEHSGAKFYGAYWCPHCQQQKAIFGASAERLPYVECTPNGPKGPRDTDCLAQEIANYPTWIISERRIERALAPRQLARYSGFEAPPGAATNATASEQ